MQHADAYGLSNEKPSFDLAKVVARSRGVAKQLNQGVTHLMKKNKIRVHMGEGKIAGKGKMTVTAGGKATELAAKHIIVATGARARDLPFAKADGKRIWTYRHAMTPVDMPTDLLVIGSGAIGIRVRKLLCRPRREGHCRRNARARRSRRGCGGQRLPCQAA